MSLSDHVSGLRDRTTAELMATHDYYRDTIFAWKLVQELADGGHQLTTLNPDTGTRRTLNELAARSYVYVFGQLHETTFQQFISVFENFFLDFLRHWLTAYPQSLGVKEVQFKDILEAPDKEAVVRKVIEHELRGLLYESPADWFAYLEKKARLGCPTADEIGRLAEAKATRDLIVHNQSVVNEMYVRKAGRFKRFELGDRVEISEQYHQQTWDLICKIVADVSTAAVAKA